MLREELAKAWRWLWGILHVLRRGVDWGQVNMSTYVLERVSEYRNDVKKV